ncbi:hypothetical protein OIU77_030559 [Salix suchowensis]|uniref:Uncharacterized protein n=1 Tax=Salix suchowensis TaxID=1278906 RepID=A0ABQ9BEF3_9ROSI|nr:hypothetical protein OIU77_030559 [Salix suchowensis]
MAETHRSMPAVDIDDSTPSKEEMEALVQTEICSGNNHDERHQSSKSEKTENDVKPKAPNLIERVKERV